jgi:hypothetical protein
MLSIETSSAGSKWQYFYLTAYPYRMTNTVMAMMQWVQMGGTSTTITHRLGFLDQVSSGGHYNDVCHLDFSGTLRYPGVYYTSNVDGSKLNWITNSTKFHQDVASGQWTGGCLFNPNTSAWQLAALRVTPIGTINRWGRIRKACWVETCSIASNSSSWSISATFYQLEDTPSPDTPRGWYYATDVYTSIAPYADYRWTAQKGGPVDVPELLDLAATTARNNSRYEQMWLSQDPNFFNTGWYSFTPTYRSNGTPPVISFPRIEFKPWLGYEQIFPMEDRNPSWGDLAREAYQDLGFYSGNGVALFNDLIHMKEAASSTLSTILSLGSRKLSAVSQLFLSFHYGWKLTVMDLEELWSSLQTNASTKRCQAAAYWSKNGADYSARYQVDYDPWAQVHDLVDLFVGLFDLELRPHTAWDMIPFSFVVDWFVQIGDVLTGLDNWYNLTRRHTVIAAGRSIRCWKQVSPRMLGLPDSLMGEVFCSYYKREYGRPIPPSILPSVTSNVPWNHSVEAAALVVSRH